MPVRARELTQQTIRTARFLPEKVRLTTMEKLTIRQLFQRMGVRARSGEEAAKAPEFLAGCKDLARTVGGDPPLPQVPDLRFLEDLSGRTGNEQLAAILGERERIERSVEGWKKLGERAGDRIRAWELAAALHRHAEGELDDVSVEVGQQLGAIRDQRSLLDETDHVGHRVTHLANALRTALSGLRDQLGADVEAATTRLAADPTWQKLDATEREAILREVGLTPPRELRVGTNEQLRDERSGAGLGLPVLAALVGGLLERRTRGATIMAGSLNLGGSLEWLPDPVAITELAVEKQANVVLMPVGARRELMNLPDDLWTKVNIEFYRDAEDGVFKILE